MAALVSVPTLRVPLMEEQRRHVEEIVKKIEEDEQKKFVLCNIPGAGKTLTCLAIAKRDIAFDKSRKVLVVAPPSAINSWTSDSSAHFEPAFRNVVLATTSEKNRCFFSSVNDCQLIILSYDTLASAHKSAFQWRTAVLKKEIQNLESRFPKDANTFGMTREDLWRYEEGRSLLVQIHSFLMEHLRTEDMSTDIPFPSLSEEERSKTLRPMLFDNLYMTRFRWLFADEVHEARNNKSVKFASIRDIRREFSVAVSATICNNSAEDYISVLKIIGVRPEQGWLSLRRNKDACASFMNTCSRELIVVSSKAVRESIRSSYFPKSCLLRPYGFRHQEEIDAYEGERIEWRNSSKKKSKDTVLKVINSLRQRCDFAETTDPTKGVVVKMKDDSYKRVVSTKLEMVVEYILQCVRPKGEKILVFVWYKDTAAVLKAMLPSTMRVDVITGLVEQKKRQRILAGFRNNRGSAVLIATPGTTSLGVNIQCANHCLLVNNWWNPVVSEQALCRIMRPGQRLSIRWVQAMIPNTVEDSIKLVADFKVELNDFMIAGEITAAMLDSITSNKAIQHAASSSSSSKRKKKEAVALPSNLLLPIVNQDTDAIIKMRSFCYQPVEVVEEEKTTSTCFLNPQLDRAEQLIQESYDYVIRLASDLEILPPTHPIDLSHVPKAKPVIDATLDRFLQRRKKDEVDKAAFLKRKRETLPDEEKGLRKHLSDREKTDLKLAALGKEKRTIKMISLDEIRARCSPEVSPVCQDSNKKQRTASSISSSIQRLSGISTIPSASFVSYFQK